MRRSTRAVITCYSFVMKLRLRRVGNSLGVIIPKHVLDQSGLAEGAEVELTADGVFFDAEQAARLGPRGRVRFDLGYEASAADRRERHRQVAPDFRGRPRQARHHRRQPSLGRLPVQRLLPGLLPRGRANLMVQRPQPSSARHSPRAAPTPRAASPGSPCHRRTGEWPFDRGRAGPRPRRAALAPSGGCRWRPP